MGEYLPPPYGLLQLASFLERKIPNLEIEVLDCQAMAINWKKLENRIESFKPDIIAVSSLATCNVYITAHTLAIAKKIFPNSVTITGGQHFSSLAQESLEEYPEIDVIIRGEGEETLVELTKAIENQGNLSEIMGISYRKQNNIIHNQSRQLITDLDTLPFPGYHFVKDYAHNYHFTMMAGSKAKYGMIEASRGCPHNCTFCSQWKHWKGTCRHKSVKRIANEIEYLYEKYDSRLIWLTDDNFGLGKRMNDLCDELINRNLSDEFTCFMQTRCDDIVNNQKLLEKMSKAGFNYLLLGVESNNQYSLNRYRKKTKPKQAKEAINLLKKHNIFSQATCIIGERSDSHESIEELRNFMNNINPDLSIFMILTPFPGTDLFEEAKRNGWIKNSKWSDYDMIHSIMPTKFLSIEEVQQELYECYRNFFGSWSRRIQSLISKNKIKRRVYRYMAKQSVLRQLKNLI
jgi:anaerobic magnesium-protoporphyrin IX monomethyl ester cyclase